MAVTVRGLKRSKNLLIRVQGVASLRPHQQALLKAIRDGEREIFAKRDWPNKKDGSPATLVKSGRLKRSVTTLTNDSLVRITDKRIDFGTKVPYGQYHQWGTKHLPRRRFFLTATEHPQIIAAIRQAMAGSVRRTLRTP